MEQELNWPLGSIVYQIYPRSFQDTNGDGIGDLPGVIKRLPYLAQLGANALWLNPIYPSPQVDFGYDVSDYQDIHPMFGTMQDFDELTQKAHEKGMRIMMDFVPNHTSTQHAWFMESKSARDNPKRDWYIWKDPKSDGSPPNNWLSVFGGSAWQFDEKTGQYYLHTFDAEQADLNWRNPAVVKEMLNVLRFWMDKGVDGFRVDVPYHMFKDSLFRDEPPNPNYQEGTHNTFDRLLHIHTAWLPESLDMMKQFAKVLQEYKNKFMVTESWGTLQDVIKTYITVGWKWFQPFNFSLITLPWTAEAHKQYIDEYDKALGDLYLPCFVLGNHDVHRVATRIGEKQARIAAMALLTLRGLPFIYYGDEIGMTDTVIPKDNIQDPFEKKTPGLGMGRDPQRTPMQWNSNKNAGFTQSTPWLPINRNSPSLNVEQENQHPTSMLGLYTLLIKLRKHHTSLREGAYIPLPHPAPNVLAYLREKDDEKILVVLNFANEQKILTMDSSPCKILATTSMDFSEGQKIKLMNYALPANEGLILEIC